MKRRRAISRDVFRGPNHPIFTTPSVGNFPIRFELGFVNGLGGAIEFEIFGGQTESHFGGEFPENLEKMPKINEKILTLGSRKLSEKILEKKEIYLLLFCVEMNTYENKITIIFYSASNQY